MDSQGRATDRPNNPVPIPPRVLVVAIYGGGIAEATIFMESYMAQQATTVILAGIGGNDFCTKSAPREIHPSVVGTEAIEGSSRIKLVFADGPATTSQAPKLNHV